MAHPPLYCGVLLSVLAGLFLAMMGIMYRLASGREIHTKYLLLIASGVGALVFGLRAAAGGLAMPPALWLLALLGGLTQIGCIYLAPVALRRGPLPAYWGANMLCFIPVIVYASLALREPFRLPHWLMLLAAVTAITAASLGAGAPDMAGAARRRAADIWLFAGILLTVLLLNGAANIFIKALSAAPAGNGQSLLDRYQGGYLLLVYLCIFAVTLGSVLADRAARPPLRPTLLLGLGVAAGSVLGTQLIVFCAVYPAALVFTTSSVVSLLGAAVAGALLFRERKNAAWYVTVLGCLAAVALAGIAR